MPDSPKDYRFKLTYSPSYFIYLFYGAWFKMNATNDMRAIRDRMDHYSVLVRNTNHEIREFPAELCRNARNRRWTCTGNDSEPRAVKNARGILRKILKNFEGMMAGIVKPTTNKILAPIVDKRPIFDESLSIPVVITPTVVAFQTLDMKGFIKPLDVKESLSMGHKAHRQTFNEYLKESTKVLFDFKQIEEQIKSLMKDADDKRQLYAVSVEWLGHALVLDSKFASVTSSFQLDIDTIESPEVDDVVKVNRRSTKQPSASMLHVDLHDIFQSNPDRTFNNEMIRKELEQRGKRADAQQVSQGLTYARTKGLKLIKVDNKNYRLAPQA